MKKIREVIRMIKENGLSCRVTSKALDISRPTVQRYISRFEKSGLTIAEIYEMSDSALIEIFESMAEGDNIEETAKENLYKEFPQYSMELLRTGVNLRLLWEEYRGKYPEGYKYSQFCYHYGLWKGSLEISMHQEYKAGDKLFVDFTGTKFPIVDRDTGEVIEKEVFVAILGASQYTYVEATDSQKKEDLIRAIENALYYFGGSPRAIIPDCLKSAVTMGNKYEPAINAEFQNFCRHYSICPLPARPYKPRDKAHVENAVKITYSWIFAVLRDRVFFSLGELNTAIREQLEIYNAKKMQKLKISRREFFEQTEQKELKSLPKEKYSFKSFSKAKIQFNYHVCLKEDSHYYSVPYRYRGKMADIVTSDRTVEIFVDNIRIAAYPRDRRKQTYTTTHEHMPPHHKWVGDWNPEKLTHWGKSLGPNIEEIIKRVLESKDYPEQAYKVCLGILSLAKKFGKERLDKACKRALDFQYYSYQGIKRILEKGLDNFEEEAVLFSAANMHENIRGREYFE